MRILLIEDSQAEARLVQEELSEVVDASFELIWVESLLKGFEVLSEKRIDLILLDLSLPDSKGLDTLIKVVARVPKVPIIVLTSLYDEATAVQAVQNGAQDYLFKGRIDSNMLVRSIRYAIERHKILMDLDHYIKKSQLSESRFKNIIDICPDGMVIVDREGIVRFANHACENLFGRGTKEFIGEQFGYPLVSGQTAEIEIKTNDDKNKKLEMQVVETEWEGEIAHYVLVRDTSKQKHRLSL